MFANRNFGKTKTMNFFEMLGIHRRRKKCSASSFYWNSCAHSFRRAEANSTLNYSGIFQKIFEAFFVDKKYICIEIIGTMRLRQIRKIP